MAAAKPKAATKHSKAPPHLAPATRAWFTEVAGEYLLEEHHVRLLLLACESWDRCVAAREALARHGLVFSDRFGCPRTRPEVAVERDSRIAFARLLRELDLDVAPPPEPGRPPAIRSNRRH